MPSFAVPSPLPPAARSPRAGARTGPQPSGFTLLELLIAVALAAALLGVAIPGYRDWIAGYQQANHAQQLAASMAYARSEALKRGARVSLCRTADGRQCAESAGWAAGWIVYVDRNRNGRVDADEPLLRVEPPAPLGVRTTANRPVEDYVSFTGSGHARLLTGGLQMGTFTVCRSGAPSTRVVLANSGRVRTEKTREPCTD